VPSGVSAIDLVTAVALVSFVISPLATLAHELGHAAVALRVSSGPVLVHVGRPPALLRCHLTRLQINWSPLPPRGVPFAGLCASRPARTPRARLAVVLAGPAVTAFLVPAFVFAMVASSDLPGWVPATWGLAALTAFVSLLYNVDPRPATQAERARAATMRRDGPAALAEFRAWHRDAGASTSDVSLPTTGRQPQQPTATTATRASSIRRPGSHSSTTR
jgi:membrane-associated protease RseP (regulator of RpoE activity)